MALTRHVTLAVRAPEDVLWARQEVKRFCAELPFGTADLGRIEVAVSELASNMVKYAGGGRLMVDALERDHQQGVRIVASDEGPGIADLSLALKQGYSTGGSLGDGLTMVAELMDTFAITSRPGQGTVIEVEKWAR